MLVWSCSERLWEGSIYTRRESGRRFDRVFTNTLPFCNFIRDLFLFPKYRIGTFSLSWTPRLAIFRVSLTAPIWQSVDSCRATNILFNYGHNKKGIKKMFPAKPNLSNLATELQISRECALLGNYDSALLYFESVLNTIHQHAKTVRDPDLKQSWLETRQTLTMEFQLIKEMAQELASFKVCIYDVQSSPRARFSMSNLSSTHSLMRWLDSGPSKFGHSF